MPCEFPGCTSVQGIDRRDAAFSNDAASRAMPFVPSLTRFDSGRRSTVVGTEVSFFEQLIHPDQESFHHPILEESLCPVSLSYGFPVLRISRSPDSQSIPPWAKRIGSIQRDQSLRKKLAPYLQSQSFFASLLLKRFYHIRAMASAIFSFRPALSRL